MSQSPLCAVARSGRTGKCSFCIGALAVILMVPGCVLLALSATNRTATKDDTVLQDEDVKEFKEPFEMQNATFRVAGALLFVAGLTLLVVTIYMCGHVCQQISSKSTSQAKEPDQPPKIIITPQTASASPFGPAPSYPSTPTGTEPPTPPPTYDDFINKGPNLFATTKF